MSLHEEIMGCSIARLDGSTGGVHVNKTKGVINYLDRDFYWCQGIHLPVTGVGKMQIRENGRRTSLRT